LLADAPPLPAVGEGVREPGRPAERVITRAAELVVLAEELYLRLFILALVLVLVCALVSIWFAAGSTAPLAVTLPFSIGAAVFAVSGLRRPRRVYAWLRYSTWHQLAPAVLGAIAMVPTGPDSPLWWPALGLVILLTAISSMWLSLLGAVLSAAGYVAGTVIGGAAIIRGGEAGILAGAVGFVAYTLVGCFVCDAFARFVLGFERHERHDAGRAEPRRVPSVVLGDPPDGPVQPAPPVASAEPAPPAASVEPGAPVAAPPSAVHRTPNARPAGEARSPLTPRQLEVALLIRDGLNQSEAAAGLGISRRQVERLLGEARARAGASTTSHLVAMLVAGGEAP
jgi:DNA-binding CsgD family transcriptional regulator